MFTLLRVITLLWLQSFLNCIVKFGAAMEVVSGRVAGAGATLTALTMNTNNSAQIRASSPGKLAYLLALWAFNDTAAGVFRVRSPRLHDFQQGIRSRIVNNDTEPLFNGGVPNGWRQRLYPQDTLTLELSGSAVNIDTAHLLLYYEDVPGVQARFIDSNLLNQAGVNVIGQEVSVTTTAASGDYTGQVAINVTNDNFKANTDYALIGAMCDVRVGTIRIQGVDVGNLGIGIPGEPTQRHVGANWFQRLAQAFQLPLIPVFNSANKAAILVDATGHTAAVTSVITFYMVELMPGKVAPAVIPAPGS